MKIEMINPRLIKYYDEYNEQERLFKDNQHKTEFIIVIEYLMEYLTKGNKVLDIGAGSGVYSIICADHGMRVNSVDISEKNLNQLASRIRESKLNNLISIHKGNAVDLSDYPDNHFDLVLNMGPIYHLKSWGEKQLAIKESLRVVKPDGIVFLMYLNKFFKYFQRLQNGKAIKDWEIVENILTKGYKRDHEEHIFFFLGPTEAEDLIHKDWEILHHIGTDGIGPLMPEAINQMSTRDFSKWIEYQKKLCEDHSLLGISLHNLIILKKK
ncbi:MAG: class I SAM-dependent methyltransferase [Candidatus Heimdallarchaeota archaeon]|nr:class I SAM-dependent methyltransferase [Candidatus Heimdallarchaeota archaeon]